MSRYPSKPPPTIDDMEAADGILEMARATLHGCLRVGHPFPAKRVYWGRLAADLRRAANLLDPAEERS